MNWWKKRNESLSWEGGKPPAAGDRHTPSWDIVSKSQNVHNFMKRRPENDGPRGGRRGQQGKVRYLQEMGNQMWWNHFLPAFFGGVFVTLRGGVTGRFEPTPPGPYGYFFLSAGLRI